jgi:hypothetical protein
MSYQLAKVFKQFMISAINFAIKLWLQVLRTNWAEKLKNCKVLWKAQTKESLFLHKLIVFCPLIDFGSLVSKQQQKWNVFALSHSLIRLSASESWYIFLFWDMNWQVNQGTVFPANGTA